MHFLFKIGIFQPAMSVYQRVDAFPENAGEEVWWWRVMLWWWECHFEFPHPMPRGRDLKPHQINSWDLFKVFFVFCHGKLPCFTAIWEHILIYFLQASYKCIAESSDFPIILLESAFLGDQWSARCAYPTWCESIGGKNLQCCWHNGWPRDSHLSILTDRGSIVGYLVILFPVWKSIEKIFKQVVVVKQKMLKHVHYLKEEYPFLTDIYVGF